MASDLTIRLATRDDLIGMAEVFLAAFPDSVRHVAGDTNPSPLAMADAFAIPLDAEPEAARVAIRGECIVGYCLSPAHFSRLRSVAVWRGHLCRLAWRWLTGRYHVGLRPLTVLARDQWIAWRERRSDPFACEAHILSIAVHPDSHGQGVGGRLLAEGLAYLQGRGVRRVRLEVRPGNAPALRLYEKFGFLPAGRTRDSQDDWLIMLKEFADG